MKELRSLVDAMKIYFQMALGGISLSDGTGESFKSKGPNPIHGSDGKIKAISKLLSFCWFKIN